jgi:hypothetical protein
VRFATLLICAISCASAATEDAPFAHEKPLHSPRGTFTIQERRDGNWHTTIHFARSAHAEIELTVDYPWPGLFYISPDDHWVLHIQKSGSGDNISFLWRVDSDGRIWRMEPAIGALAFGPVATKISFRQGDGRDVWRRTRLRVL